MTARYLTLFVCLFFCTPLLIQAQSDSTDAAVPVNSKVINGLQKQYGGLQSKLDKQSAKLLSKMQRQEDKLRKKLSVTDSIKANELFTEDVQQRYASLQSSLTQKTDKLKQFPLKEYVPGVDSVQTALNFIAENTGIPSHNLENINKLQTQLKDLQHGLQNADDIQAFVREREAQLKEQLMNTALAKQLKGINKEVYYYQQQLEAYKAVLDDKEKLKAKLLETVRTLPAFQKFWQKNSYLAQLFGMPGNYNSTAQALPGLQTTTSIQQTLQQRFGMQTVSAPGGNVTGGDFFQQQAGTAQDQLNQLKDKINNALGGNSDITVPDFKPNEQKTKSLFKRLEYGLGFQSDKGTALLPATTDIAANLGYKISDNKVIGIGISYKLGWGSGWDNIKLSSEGVGLRSYVDIKIKGGFWLSGGAEYNYLSAFKQLRELHDQVDVWQSSALLGITKKYKIGKTKEGKIQVLYDFLHNQQTPPSQGLIFRAGWNF